MMREELVREIVAGNNRSTYCMGIIDYPMIGSYDGVIVGIPAKFF